MLLTHYRDRSGFTLMELIIIIAILGIISVVAVARFGTIEKDVGEKVVADRFLQEIKYLRNYAINRHDTTWAVFDHSTNQYGLYAGPTSGSRTLIPDPHTGATSVVDIDDEYNGVDITSVDFGGSQEVSFNWWGAPSSGGTIVINGTITLVLEPETGIIYEQ